MKFIRGRRCAKARPQTMISTTVQGSTIASFREAVKCILSKTDLSSTNARQRHANTLSMIPKANRNTCHGRSSPCSCMDS